MNQIGRYPVLEKIGSGGMGEVYLAKDPVLGRKVAIKVLHKEFVSDPIRLARFEKEAKAASALEHPGVAHIYEIGEADGVHFIAMQYVEGLTLSEKIEKERPSFAQILDWAIQICEAIEEAHLQGIIHRDLKPQNIMVTEQGQIKILDFGIAKTLHQGNVRSQAITDTGVIMGTVDYMSPEQALGKQIDHRSDIFSIGALLYEVVTGRLPFRGENTMETLQKVLHEEPERPIQRNPSIPADFERIILKCMEKDPARRFQSMHDLLIDLRTLNQETGADRATVSLVVARPKSNLWWAGMIALLLIAVGSIVYFQIKAKPIRSLAVLPFMNEAKDPNLEYLSDGITDEIINKLSQVPELKVLSRATVFRFKGRHVDPRKVGDELDVDAIISGSFARHQDQLRVQVSLVRVPEGNQMWGELYTWKMDDIQQMQAQISRDIYEHLPQRLSGEVRQQIARQHTQDPVAYQLFLEGRFHLNRRTRESLDLGIQSFQAAIDRDPEYAAAYAGLADGYILRANWGFLPPDRAFPRAKAAALTALELDQSLAEAHTALGWILSAYEWKWKEAEESFRKAIALNPNYATAHQWYALCLTLQGRFEEAVREIRTAQQLDPLSLIVNANVGYILYFARYYDRAIEELQKAKELDPKFALNHEILGYIYGQEREFDQSIAAMTKAVDLAPDNLSFKADLAWSYAVAGERGKAEQMLDRLIQISSQSYVAPYHIAGICVGLGRNQEAIDWLEKAYNDRSDQVTYIGRDPRFDSLRKDPRFQDLVRRIGLQ